jgi:hypothetical protein
VWISIYGAPTSAAALICAKSASINSETRIPASARRAGIAHFVELAGHIQTAFGGHFLTFFRHQAAEMRFGLAGNRQHLFGDRHLKIHAGVQRLAQNTHIAIGNMATVFAQMHGNAVSASLLGDKGRLNRIRISRAARVTQVAIWSILTPNSNSAMTILVNRYSFYRLAPARA